MSAVSDIESELDSNSSCIDKISEDNISNITRDTVVSLEPF